MSKRVVAAIEVGKCYWCCHPFYGVCPSKVKYLGNRVIEVIRVDGIDPVRSKKLKVRYTILYATRAQALEAKKSELQARLMELAKQSGEVCGQLDAVQVLIDAHEPPVWRGCGGISL